MPFLFQTSLLLSRIYAQIGIYYIMRPTTEIFKSLGDQNNLRILNLLSLSGQELCVCELVDSLAEKQYNVSKHLKELVGVGLINSRKEGRWVYYSLSKGKSLKELLRFVNQLTRGKTFGRDEVRLRQRLRLRQNGKCLLGIQNRNLHQ